MALTKRTWQAMRLRAAVIEAGEAYCCDPDPASSVGGIMCTRPAGHTGKHAAHGTDPDKPLWTWPNEEGTSDGSV